LATLLPRYPATLLLSVLLLAVSACTQRPSEATVIIGVIAPRSGEFGPLGESTVNGVQLAVDEINGTTGVNLDGRRARVVVRVEDDRGQGSMAEAAVKKLADARVVAVIGPVQPDTAQRAAGAAATHGLPLIVPTVSDPGLTGSGPLIFRACYDDTLAGEALAVYAFNTLRARRAAVVFDTATPYNGTLARFFTSRFTALGGAVIVQAPFTDERMVIEFRSIIARVRAARPDVLVSPNYYRATAAIATQMREMGVRIPILAGEGVNSPDFPLIGGEAVEGTLFPVHFAPDDPRQVVVRFRVRYQSTYKRDPDAFAALAYDATRLLLAALSQAGSTDPGAIRTALLGTRDFLGVTGTMTYAGLQTPRKDVPLVRVKNGAFGFETAVRP
jgi:branched-chain amino acid transport system substrate-binding protein